ncbi:hybrid sensor histidine kinase/response regulator transcription factor [Spirosoma validum]|uniref:histidine kinase n=1 Tax=Spirosoma validum TaxID=2771355 RepID=A0A927B0W1_9BACT|nr:hybrid sensor histidine kinase/response regulator transcription factor [Spirosoma validum]MBD2753484.1 response regulator [Spirosoma validum]
MPRLFLFLTALILVTKGVAQTSHTDQANRVAAQPLTNYFDHLSVEDGLSSNSVMCILQDREGFMWFGTNDGLNKYDGYTFTTLKRDLNDTVHGFQNNQIYHLCEDYKNRLWVATLGGLHEVDKRTGQVTPHPIRASNADKWNYQHSVYEDSQRILWVSTLGGLARYEADLHRFTLYPLPQPEATIKTVFEDPQHRFWVATYEGLYLFDRSTGRFTLIPAPVAAGAAQPTFIAFYLDPQQVLWLGTSTAGKGLFRLDLRRQPWHLEPYNPEGKIISYTFLNSIRTDPKGNLWVATTNGLHRVDPVHNQAFTFLPAPNAPKGISSNFVQTVYYDRSGTLWVGTDNGIDRQAVNMKPFMVHQVRPNSGIANLAENKVVALLPDAKEHFWTSSGFNVYRPAVGTNRTQLLAPEILGSDAQFRNYTQAFLPDGPDGIWLGTWTGLYHFDQKTGHVDLYPSEIPIEYVSRALTGEIWVGGYIVPNSGIASFDPRTHQYKYYKYNPKDPNGLPDQYIHSLLVSQSGDVWVPFRKNGIARLNPRTGSLIHYVAGPRSGLNNNDMQTIYEDRSGVIWVGTQQGGVNRFDARTGRFSALTTRDGLPSNNVVGITNDNAGNLWLSTDKGLCRFDLRTKAVRNYQTTNGLPSNDFLRNAVFRQKDRLYFGSLNGIVYFNPDSIRDDTRPFPVYITELKVRDQVRPLNDSVITLEHDENFLSFSFAALTYTQAGQNQYAYQLVGVDKDWAQSGNRHFANYTNLPPGTYVFRVKAANSDGIWNEKGASIRLVIQPPWWATWWAYCLYALLAGGAIWRYIRFYTNRIRQRQELELNRREAEQLKTVDELKTRFFSNITHEFRTPLSLIISPVEKLLQENRFDAPTRQILTLLQRNADQLLRLINQLLDLSKLEANHMAISLMRGEVLEFITQVVEPFRQAAAQKGVTLEYTADGLPQEEQLFDADKWEKILTNLLSNAVKFTSSGGHVTVKLTAASSNVAGAISDVQIQITDTGIGISPENLPHIFDRFYQVDNSRTRAYEGTGIGLALVKELIDLVGGTIRVDSQQTIGTTFVVTLPVKPVLMNDQAPRVILPGTKYDSTNPVVIPESAANQSVGEDQVPLVLIVEDNEELREFLAGELAATYRVLRAIDGETGWQLTQSELPDIVISDIMMPRMDGYELTRLIKTNTDTDHITVVLLTAKAAHTSRIEGLKEGADDYLSKPFHLDELHLRLRNLISHQQKLRDHYRQQFAQPDMPSPINMVGDAFLHRVYKLLEDNLSDPSLDVDWLADQMAMSRKTLYRKIHNLVQLAPNELIRQYRLRKAADLLRAGYHASETAYRVGFKTPSYFTIVFKEFYQKTPTEFAASGLSKA